VKVLVTGVIGSDTHIVGNRILSMALEKAGYKVITLGALTPAVEFIRRRWNQCRCHHGVLALWPGRARLPRLSRSVCGSRPR